MPLTAGRDAAISLDGVVCGFNHDYGLLTVQVPSAAFLVPAAHVASGERRRLRIGARDVSLARDQVDSTILNMLQARILSVSPTGKRELTAVLMLGAEDGGTRLLARITRQSWDRLELAVGQQVLAQVKGIALA